MRLDGKAALVTGAGKGLGRAIALGLARAGADVALISRTQADLEVLGAEVESLGRRALVVVADITRSREVNRAVDQAAGIFGHIDILVHSVGGSLRKPA